MPVSKSTCAVTVEPARRAIAKDYAETVERLIRSGGWQEAPAPEDQPMMRSIYVRGLSKHTHGNAAGIGNADFTNTRLVNAMNYRATVINCLTAGYPEGANLPVHFETDREVLDAALAIIGTRSAEQARVMHIRNTMQLEEMEISEACLSEPEPRTRFGKIIPARSLCFDGKGNLRSI